MSLRLCVTEAMAEMEIKKRNAPGSFEPMLCVNVLLLWSFPSGDVAHTNVELSGRGFGCKGKNATLCFLSFLFVAWLLCILGVLSEQDSLSLLLSMSIQAEWPRLLEGLALHGGVSAGCGDGEAAERTRQYNSPWSLEDLSGPRGPECTIMTAFYPVCHCKV